MNTVSKIATGFLIIASCSVVLLATSSLRSRAQDVPPAVNEGGRYHTSAWAYPGSNWGAARTGAYIVDSQTGKVWLVENDKKPREIGAIPK